MKKWAALLTMLCMAAAFCFAADPAEGYWISYDEKTGKATAGWKIWEEGGELKGEITSLADLPQDQLATAGTGKSYADFYHGTDIGTLSSVGTQWIWGLKKKSAGNWEKGSIIDPGSGDKYACKVTFHAADGKKYKVDTLEMRGSIGPFGRSQYWQKASETEARSLR